MKPIDQFLLRCIALAIILDGAWTLLSAFAAGGVFGVLWSLALGIFLLSTGVGFWKVRGWAFLVVSVVLLVGFFYWIITMIVSIDTGENLRFNVFAFVTNIVLIGYVGRWGIERHFRPHLELEH